MHLIVPLWSQINLEKAAQTPHQCWCMGCMLGWGDQPAGSTEGREKDLGGGGEELAMAKGKEWSEPLRVVGTRSGVWNQTG